MSDREKLIELMNEVWHECNFDKDCSNCEYADCTGDVPCIVRFFADHLISNGVTVQKWIPVSDRLPEVRTPVLTYGRKGAVGIGFTQPSSVTAEGKVYFYARYGDSLPTHWMPLPEPPKERE